MKKLIIAAVLLATSASVVAAADDPGPAQTVETVASPNLRGDLARGVPFSAIDVAAAITSSTSSLEPGDSDREPPSSAASALAAAIAKSPAAGSDDAASTTASSAAASTPTSAAPGRSGPGRAPTGESPQSASPSPTSPPATTPPPTTPPGPPPPKHHLFSSDTNFTKTFRLRPGDTVELRNGACLCFGPGGNADWRGTKTATWSDEGRTQNLSRDIRIFGSGHIRFGHGSTASTITYVEIDLRPPVELAEYPLHWHHAGEGARGTLVEGVVVKNSPNRAFVPHASHGITFRHTIAKDVAGSAYWWDPPPFQSRDRSNNSNDIVYDHALADGVVALQGQPGHRLMAFALGAGSGNQVVNSVAMNVKGGKDSAGFQWPESHRNQPNTWRFENNVAHHNATNGIFVWSNSGRQVIRGYRGYSNGRADIDHGAYTNQYHYRGVRAAVVEVHALGWSVTGGTLDKVVSKRHRLDAGPVTFTNVTVGSFIVDNAARDGQNPGDYVFTNTGLTWDRVTIRSAVRGTTVTIDGETRTY